jgi:hypothetical protein
MYIARRAIGAVASIFILFLSACGQRQSPLPSNALESSPATGSRRYVVVIPFWVCPNPSDFHVRIDGLIKGDLSVALPPQCRELEASAIVVEPPGSPPLVQYRGFDIQQATLPNGQTFWSDELTGDSLRETQASALPKQ